MKVEEYDNRIGREVLAGMVTDPVVLGRVAPRWERAGLFESTWENLVAGWCVKHWHKYGSPPGKAVRSYFARWAEGQADSGTAGLVEDFLVGLSDEWERNGDHNSRHTIDLAGEHFAAVQARRLRDALDADLAAGDVVKAEQRILAHRKLELGADEAVDPFTQPEVVDQFFSSSSLEPIVHYPGPLGEFFADALTRDSFIAFEGPEKSGKSWHLLDLAFTAFCQRRLVAYFECGDMSQSQVGRRLMSRTAKQPTRSTNADRSWPCEIKWPISISPPSDKKLGTSKARVPRVEYELLSFDKPLKSAEAKSAVERIMLKRVKSKKSRFRLQCHPAGSVSAAGIRSKESEWVRDGWVPDVVVVDYADILAPITDRLERRDQYNETWTALRALAQEFHCLVVTGTQADAESYDAYWITRKNFSEDKRKLSHASGIVGINVTAAERDAQTCRLGWVVGREWDYSVQRGVYVARCLPLANPCVVSCW